MKNFMHFLYESTRIDIALIDSLIRLSTDKQFHPFSGNCGVFAIGLAHFLDKLNVKNLEYWVYGNNFDSRETFINNKVNIFHVTLSVGDPRIGTRFDGSGVVDKVGLNKIMAEYGHTIKTASFLRLNFDDKPVEKKISDNTKRNLTALDFYDRLAQTFKKLG